MMRILIYLSLFFVTIFAKKVIDLTKHEGSEYNEIVEIGIGEKF